MNHDSTELYDAADELMDPPPPPDEREIAEWALAECARSGAPEKALETLAMLLHVDTPDLWERA